MKGTQGLWFKFLLHNHINEMEQGYPTCSTSFRDIRSVPRPYWPFLMVRKFLLFPTVFNKTGEAIEPPWGIFPYCNPTFSWMDQCPTSCSWMPLCTVQIHDEINWAEALAVLLGLTWVAGKELLNSHITINAQHSLWGVALGFHETKITIYGKYI